MIRRFSTLVAFGLLVAPGCTQSNFGGAGKDKKKSDKSESEGTIEEDDEEQVADKPVEVAGAFLTIACAPTHETPEVMDATHRPFGCAMVDKDTRSKASGNVTIDKVEVRYEDGGSENPTLSPAPQGSVWHALTSLLKDRVSSIKTFSAQGSVDGTPYDVVNNDIHLYDPEGLIGTDDGEQVTDGDDPLPPIKDPELLAMEVFAGSNAPQSSRSYAIDDDSRTVYQHTSTKIWLLVKLEKPYFVTSVAFEVCEADSGKVNVTLGLDVKADSVDGEFVEVKKAKLEFTGEEAKLKKARVWDLTQHSKDDREALYVKFEVEGTGAAIKCLNDIKIYGVDPS